MAKSKQVIFTDKAVKPVGPYSQAVRAGDFLFISGTVPVDPVTGEVVAREIAVQTRQVFDSIKAILTAVEGAEDSESDAVERVRSRERGVERWPRGGRHSSGTSIICTTICAR